MGTRALPTAELELKNTRAYLIGKGGEGVKEINSILNITRLNTPISALGYWSMGVAVSRAFTSVRRVSGRGGVARGREASRDNRYHAAMKLKFLVLALLGVNEQDLMTMDN